MKYILDQKRFKRVLLEKGFRNVTDFARKTGIHRNTLVGLISGRSVLVSSFAEVADRLSIDPQELMIASSTTKSRIPQIDEIRPLIASLTKIDKQFTVVLIGSRASRKSKKYSDWDLGILRYPEPLMGLEFLKLKRLVAEGSENLVRTVDLVNLNEAPRWFLEGLGDHILFLDGNREGWTYFKGVLDGIRKEKQAA